MQKLFPLIETPAITKQLTIAQKGLYDKLIKQRMQKQQTTDPALEH